jgi:tRNA A37 threonylcarbamoyladenosine dehydratase
VDLIQTAMERGIPIISALGTGNKLDAEKLTVCDISATHGCPLARVVRKELRVKGHRAPHGGVQPRGGHNRPCRWRPRLPAGAACPAPLVWVPASAGLLLCQHVVTELIK